MLWQKDTKGSPWRVASVWPSKLPKPMICIGYHVSIESNRNVPVSITTGLCCLSQVPILSTFEMSFLDFLASRVSALLILFFKEHAVPRGPYMSSGSSVVSWLVIVPPIKRLCRILPTLVGRCGPSTMQQPECSCWLRVQDMLISSIAALSVNSSN